MFPWVNCCLTPFRSNPNQSMKMSSAMERSQGIPKFNPASFKAGSTFAMLFEVAAIYRTIQSGKCGIKRHL